MKRIYRAISRIAKELLKILGPPATGRVRAVRLARHESRIGSSGTLARGLRRLAGGHAGGLAPRGPPRPRRDPPDRCPAQPLRLRPDPGPALRAEAVEPPGRGRRAGRAPRAVGHRLRVAGRAGEPPAPGP